MYFCTGRQRQLCEFTPLPPAVASLMAADKHTVSPLYVVASTSEVEDPVEPRARADRRLRRVQCIAWAVGAVAVLAVVASAVLACSLVLCERQVKMGIKFGCAWCWWGDTQGCGYQR